MRDTHDENDELTVFDLINNPIVTSANSVQATSALQFLAVR